MKVRSLLAVVLTLAALPLAARSDAPIPVTGRWDLTFGSGRDTRAGWLELTEDANGLHGRFQGIFYAPEPLTDVTWGNRTLTFTSGRFGRFVAAFDGRKLTGTARYPGTDSVRWVGVRAPELAVASTREGRPVAIFDGRTLDGWRARHGRDHGWIVRDGALVNLRPSDDLVTLQRWTNFKLHLQYRLQPREDSGVHLRGRYEIQLTENEDPATFAGGTGSVYGMVAPLASPAKPPGEWNTLDLTLVGRRLDATLNGVAIHRGAIIPGPTGDALDSDEGAPGPIMLQGYIGGVEYKDIVLTPLR